MDLKGTKTEEKLKNCFCGRIHKEINTTSMPNKPEKTDIKI